MRQDLFKLPRKCVLLVLCCAGALQTAHAAYPEKPVRWIIPGAAGGAADAVARVVAAAVSASWGQPIVIDNRPGATGTIANDGTAKAAPDGYTLGEATMSTYVMANHVLPRVPYKPKEDFINIAKLCSSPYLLGVTKSLPVNSVAELVALAKARPDELNYGSSGNGSALHVVTELFRSSAGIKLTHVPYKSVPASEMDLIGGQIQMMVGNFSTMATHVQSGKIRPLATTGPKRSPLLPNVPTMAEVGFPVAEVTTWIGVMGPAKLPPAIAAKIHDEFTAAVKNPKVIKQLADIGCDADPTSMEAFDRLVNLENEKWGAVIKKNNITAD
jgi:tripartite-type tricarboxylate transporter receptor subunit TctC